MFTNVSIGNRQNIVKDLTIKSKIRFFSTINFKSNKIPNRILIYYPVEKKND